MLRYSYALKIQGKKYNSQEDKIMQESIRQQMENEKRREEFYQPKIEALKREDADKKAQSSSEKSKNHSLPECIRTLGG